MSQVLEPLCEPDVTRQDPTCPEDASPPPQSSCAFEYRPMPVLAPVSGVLGVASLIAFLGLFGILVALVGVLVSLLAWWQIRRARGGLSGRMLAVSGFVLSVVSGVSGAALQVYLYKHEVPEGFERVSFSQDISAKRFVVEDGVQRLHPDVEALLGKPIFIKGFMYPTGQEYDLPGFLLLKDSGQCCFGGQPALQDMIGVQMAPGKEVDYYNGRVSIAGTLKINPNYRGGSLEPLYLFDGEIFSKARTSF